MNNKDSNSIYQCYRLVVEGLSDIKMFLSQFENETWYRDALNLFTFRLGNVKTFFDSVGAETKDLPRSWSANDKDKPLFTDNDVKTCIRWIQSGVLSNDILLKYIIYKQYNLQQTRPIANFSTFNDFDSFVDAEKQQREERVKVKTAAKSVEWNPMDVLFENDDLVILNGADRYVNIRLRATLQNATGEGYTFCISNPNLSQNMYDTYRHDRGQYFYWLYFKKIPVRDRYHICVLSITQDGVYEWSLADNRTERVDWDTLVQTYIKYGINLDKPLKNKDGRQLDSVKDLLVWQELTEEELEDKEQRDIINKALTIDFSIYPTAYRHQAVLNAVNACNNELRLKRLSDCLDVSYINADIWSILPEYTHNVIINRVPPEILKEEIINSQTFINNTKLVQRYTTTLTRSTRSLSEYLLRIMSTEQVENQIKGMNLKMVNTPLYYTKYFSPNFLAVYFARTAVESGLVKRPENWVSIPTDKRYKLLSLIVNGIEQYKEIDEQLLSHTADIFVQLPSLYEI